MLRLCYNKQVPSHFAIYPVPKEIISWIESLRNSEMLSMELHKRPEPSNLEHLAAGKGFCPSVVSKTPICLTLAEKTNMTSLVLSRTPSETMNLAKQLNLPLHGGTVSATINNVAKTFREASLDDPLLENNGKKYLKLQRQLKGYVDLEPYKSSIHYFQRQHCLSNLPLHNSQ